MGVNIQFRFEGDHSGERSKAIEDQGLGAYEGHIPRIGEGVVLMASGEAGLHRCRVVDVWTIVANQQNYSAFVAVYVRPETAARGGEAWGSHDHDHDHDHDHAHMHDHDHDHAHDHDHDHDHDHAHDHAHDHDHDHGH